MASLVGNPQDIISTPYGYSGQMAPETAIAEQSLNRRRLLANMLTQQGLQPQQGRMVGRFFVGPSPVQGGAGLAQVLAGSLGNLAIDKKQKALMDDDRAMVVKAIQDWKDRQKQLADVSQAPVGSAPSQVAPPAPTEQAPPPSSPLPESGAAGPSLQNIGPRPQQPAPNMTVPSDPQAFLNQPPVDYRNPADQRMSSGVDPSGLDMTNVVPGDMSTMVGSADPAKAQAQLGDQAPVAQTPAQPAPVPPAAPPQQMAAAGAPRKTTMDDLAELLTHQHPQVRAYGQILAQQMQKEQEREQQQNFLSQEKAMDRDVRREGILENSRMREAQMQNTMALTQMQIEARMQQGKDANDLKESLAKQTAELQRLQIQTNAELKKAEMGSRADIAKQHDETLKAIAQTKQQSKGTLPAPALKLQNEELDAIGAAAGIQKDMASVRAQVESGKLQLGPIKNFMSQGKNYAGMSDENSRNFASFKATLERMRNESLRLNKGVQTEGDSVRAWNELLDNINDPEVVKQRLAEIEAQNQRAVTLRQMNIDTIRQNFGAEPLDTSGYQSQPATVGANKGQAAPAAPQRTIKRTGTHNGKKVVEYSDGSIEYAP